MTQNHTPGPWKIRELSCEDHRGMGWVEDANGRDIACCGAQELRQHENRANASLIAAAPDLLAALELLYDHCRLYHPDVEYNNVGEMVRAAIAKAKGAA